MHNATSFNNMFGDFFKNILDWNMFDFSKNNSFFGNDAMRHSKRHLDAASTAQHLVMSNLQALIKRQSEILQDNTARLMNCCKEASSLNTPEQLMEKQAAFVKETLDANLAHTRELTEMTTKAYMELLNHAGNQASENINECCKHATKK